MTSKPRIALATCADLPDLTPDDRLFRDVLVRRGADVVTQVWDGDGAWSGLDAVVIRTCWDYFLKHADFLAWIDTLTRDGVAFWNPAPVLCWNSDKSYLRELAAAGTQIVPTHWVAHGGATSLASILEQNGWSEAVVKPTVSASAHQTRRVAYADCAREEAWFRERAQTGSLMVQPFLNEITRDGEWSLVFFGGRFSHAAVKRPADGDYRVQPDFGGTHAAVTPDAALIATAERIVARAPGDCLYARVDGCVVDGTFLLMELEVLEPALFFGHSENAAARLADELLLRARTQNRDLA